MKETFRHIILTAGCILWPFGFVAAQDIPPVHRDSTGRLFIRSSTPVGVFISTNPSGNNAIPILSEQLEGNPLRWRNHGPKQLTYMNLYTGKHIHFDLFADGLPPKSSVAFDPTKGFLKNSIIHLSEGGVIELSATDPHAGTLAIYYSVNSSQFVRYEKPVAFDTQGNYTIRFYALDRVGNREDEGERQIVIDGTPPVTGHTVFGPLFGNVVAKGSSLQLNPTDELGVRSTFYQINNGPTVTYQKPIAIGQLPEGEHTVSWYSTDMVGNSEAPSNFTFFVDKTPPLVFEEISGSTYMIAGREFSSGRSQLRIVGVDNKAGIRDIFYSINGREFVRYEKPIYLSDITGAVSVRSYAVDNLGNRSESATSGQQFTMPEIDITGPAISYTFEGKRLVQRDTTWVSPLTKIGISATDRGSGLNRVEFKLNELPTVPFTGKFSVSTEGYHTVSITAFDNVENLNIASFGFGVDASAPEIFYHFSQKPFRVESIDNQTVPVFTPGLRVFLAATDNIAGLEAIYFSVGGSRERSYTEPIGGFRAGTLYELKIRATDLLGNESARTIRFRVE